MCSRRGGWTPNRDRQLVVPVVEFSFRPAEDAFTEPAPISPPGQLAFDPASRPTSRATPWPVPRSSMMRTARTPRPGGVPARRVTRSSSRATLDPLRGCAVTCLSRRSSSTSAETPWCLEGRSRRRRGLPHRVRVPAAGRHFGAAGLVSSGGTAWQTFAVRVGIDESATAVWSELRGSRCGRGRFWPKGGASGPRCRLSCPGKAGLSPTWPWTRGQLGRHLDRGRLLHGRPATVMWAFSRARKLRGGRHSPARGRRLIRAWPRRPRQRARRVAGG